MSKTLRMTVVMLAGLGLTASPALAQGHGHGEKGGAIRLERHDHDPFMNSGPPGASHGKKTGWGNCDLPPGQAKKEGCHHFAHRRNVVRATNPVVVRRPVAEVHAHAGVDARVH